jgi:hypothetical protein
METGEREGDVNEVGCEPFAGGAVRCGNNFSLIGGKVGMGKAVEEVDGGLKIFSNQMQIKKEFSSVFNHFPNS